MKNRNLSLAIVASSLIAFASCDEIMGDKETPVLQPDEQKGKLEQVAVKLMEKAPSEDFEKYVDLYNSFVQEYLENEEYDYDALYDFAEEVADQTTDAEFERVYNEMKKEYTKKKVLNFAVALSNHKCEFVFGEDAITKVSGSSFDGAKGTLPMDGKTYTLEVKPSDKVTRATYDYISYYKYWDPTGYYDQDKDEWVYISGGVNIISDYRNRFVIDVPEKIEIGVYEDGKYILTVTISMTQSFSAEGLDPAVDNFNADVTVSIDNGWEVELDKFAFDGSKGKAGSEGKIKKNGETLVSYSVSGDVELVNSKYVYEEEDVVDEFTTVEVKKLKDVAVSIDILGEVQVKGTCSNVKEAYEAVGSFWEAIDGYDHNTHTSKTPDEAAAMRYLNNLNAKLDLGVYYDGGSNKQASVEFEMDKREYEWGTDYDIMPVIVFADNSRYTVEDYFTEEAFESLLNKMEGFGEDYEDLLGTIY